VTIKKFCKDGYDRQAKEREWASRPTSTPNPRTNKQISYSVMDGSTKSIQSSYKQGLGRSLITSALSK
jgi:hypothetical protein